MTGDAKWNVWDIAIKCVIKIYGKEGAGGDTRCPAANLCRVAVRS